MEREIRKRAPRKNPPSSGQPPETNVEGEGKARGVEGNRCKSCDHPNRKMIEEMTLDGSPWREIERSIAVGNKDIDPTSVAIHRHAKVCIPGIMQRRMDAILAKDDLTAEVVMRHIKGALRQSEQSADMVFDEDEHGAPREAAQGRSAAIRTRVECARAAGELIGLFQSSKVEMLLKSPETQEILNKIVEVICSDCAVKVREIVGGEENG